MTKLQVRRKSLRNSSVLAGKYDVYVDFVPPVIDGVALAEEKTRLEFRLVYPRADRNGTSNISRDDDDDPDLIIAGDSVGDNKVKTLKVWSALELPQPIIMMECGYG